MQLVAVFVGLLGLSFVDALDFAGGLDEAPTFVDVDLVHLTLFLLPPIRVDLSVAVLQLADALGREREAAVVGFDMPTADGR